MEVLEHTFLIEGIIKSQKKHKFCISKDEEHYRQKLDGRKLCPESWPSV